VEVEEAQRQKSVDPTALRGGQYRTADNLEARQSIYAYRQPPLNMAAAVLSAVVVTGDELVLDVGCGNGRYLAELGRRGHRGPLIGTDISEGMLKAARQQAGGARVFTSEASALPLGDGVAGLVLAMHMLYHVQRPAKALAELGRVLKPGGRLVVALNDADHLHELRTACGRAAEEMGLPDGTFGFGERLRLDDGEKLLHGLFSNVARHDLAGELVVDAAYPVAAYLKSMEHVGAVPDGRHEAYIERVIDHLGGAKGPPFRVTAHAGFLVCT
jgi:SAM-dependent methyltransferase